MSYLPLPVCIALQKALGDLDVEDGYCIGCNEIIRDKMHHWCCTVTHNDEKTIRAPSFEEVLRIVLPAIAEKGLLDKDRLDVWVEDFADKLVHSETPDLAMERIGEEILKLL